MNHDCTAIPARAWSRPTPPGRALRQLDMHPATAGDSLVLTLDSALQKVAYNALGDQDGAVVALDPNTGGVLAMVSKPGYNPDLFVDGISHANYTRLLKSPQAVVQPGSARPVSARLHGQAVHGHRRAGNRRRSTRTRRSGAPATSRCPEQSSLSRLETLRPGLDRSDPGDRSQLATSISTSSA